VIANFGDAVRATKRALPGKDYYFDRVEALYWWLYEHHSGMSSWEYAAACKLSQSYKPGTMDNGPMTEMSQLMYEARCVENGCADIHGEDERWRSNPCLDGDCYSINTDQTDCSVCGQPIGKEN